MADRISLHNKLIELLENNNAYYQAPTATGMNYPAIKYSLSNINSTFANNGAYLLKNRYELIVIDKRPDNPVIKKLLALPYCTYDRHYVADNLHHDVLTLYW